MYARRRIAHEPLRRLGLAAPTKNSTRRCARRSHEPMVVDFLALYLSNRHPGRPLQSFRRLKRRFRRNDSMTPNEFEYRFNTVRRLLETGQLDVAEERCRELVQCFPTDARTWALAADVAFKLGKWAPAAEFLSKATDLAPQNAELAIRYAHLLYRTGQIVEALRVASQASMLETPRADL